MITRRIVFKDFDLAKDSLNSINTTYHVSNHLTRTEQGLQLTFEIKDENLEEYLNLIESFELETY